MTAALTELKEKTAMFNGADDEIYKAKNTLQKLQTKYDVNTEKMYQYELEKEHLGQKLLDAEERLLDLEQINSTNAQRLDAIADIKYKAEAGLLIECERNEALLAENKMLEDKLVQAQTSDLFAVQQTLAETELENVELKTENDNRRKGAELDARIAADRQIFLQ